MTSVVKHTFKTLNWTVLEEREMLGAEQCDRVWCQEGTGAYTPLCDIVFSVCVFLTTATGLELSTCIPFLFECSLLESGIGLQLTFSELFSLSS